MKLINIGKFSLNLLFCGDTALPYASNVHIFQNAHKYILDTKRFLLRSILPQVNWYDGHFSPKFEICMIYSLLPGIDANPSPPTISDLPINIMICVVVIVVITSLCVCVFFALSFYPLFIFSQIILYFSLTLLLPFCFCHFYCYVCTYALCSSQQTLMKDFHCTS